MNRPLNMVFFCDGKILLLMVMVIERKYYVAAENRFDIVFFGDLIGYQLPT